MILPQPVNHAQHHHPLVIAHGRRAQNLFLRLVLLLQLLEDRLAQFVPAQLRRLDPRRRQIQPEVVNQLLVNPFMFHWSGCSFSPANSSRMPLKIPPT